MKTLGLILLTAALAVSAAVTPAWALRCREHTVTIDGRTVRCETCCYANECETTCR
jgi:hypothetical protein